MTDFTGPDQAPTTHDEKPFRLLPAGLVAGVAIAVIAIGVLAGWFSGGSDSAPAKTTTTAAAVPSTTSTTVADGTGDGEGPAAPPTGVGATGELPTWTAGYSRLKDGIPVGYSQNVAGARAAAANLVTSLGRREILTSKGLARTVSTWAADADGDWATSASDFDTLEDAFGLDGRTVPDDAVIWAAPANVTVERYSDGEAIVSVYSSGLFVWPEGPNPTRYGASWSQTRVQLVWADKDWKVADTTVLSGAPTPAPLDQPAAAIDVVEAMGGGR